MIYDRIKTLCQEKGISVAFLEREAGLSNGAISKWNESSPTLENLQAVAKVLKIKIQKLIVWLEVCDGYGLRNATQRNKTNLCRCL